FRVVFPDVGEQLENSGLGTDERQANCSNSLRSGRHSANSHTSIPSRRAPSAESGTTPHPMPRCTACVNWRTLAWPPLPLRPKERPTFGKVSLFAIPALPFQRLADRPAGVASTAATITPIRQNRSTFQIRIALGYPLTAQRKLS